MQLLIQMTCFLGLLLPPRPSPPASVGAGAKHLKKDRSFIVFALDEEEHPFHKELRALAVHGSGVARAAWFPAASEH